MSGLRGVKGAGSHAPRPPVVRRVLRRPGPEASPPARALLEGLTCVSSQEGELVLPCVPSLAEALGRRVVSTIFPDGPARPDEAVRVHRELAIALRRGFEASPYSVVRLRYAQQRRRLLRLAIQVESQPVGEHFDRFYGRQGDRGFDPWPDAKVLEMAGASGPPSRTPVLELGPGVGRNALALARLGHPVTVLELSTALAQRVRERAAGESLPVHVVLGDVSAGPLPAHAEGYALVTASRLVPHLRDAAALRRLAERCADVLRPGGALLFDVFLAAPGTAPEPVVRELAHRRDSLLCTREELQAVLNGLPLTLLASEPVVDFESRHRPPGRWPAQPWFEGWAGGTHMFPDDPTPRPMELHWISCRRR